MATRNLTSRKVYYTKGKSVKKRTPYYSPYSANPAGGSGVKSVEGIKDSITNWKKTPKWQQKKLPLVYTSKKNRR